MAVRTIQQIQKELAGGDKAQRKVINQQLAALPGQFQGQKKGLQAQQKQAFGDILGGAKQRGLKFSGIPLDEQAQYTSTQFLPALANLESQRNTQRSSLQATLADILAQRSISAQSLRQTELDREFQRQEAEKARAAARQAARAASAASAFDFGNMFGGAGAGETLSGQTATPAQLLEQSISGGAAQAQKAYERANAMSSGSAAQANEVLRGYLYRAQQTGSKRSMSAFNRLAELLKFQAAFDLSTGKYNSNFNGVTPITRPGTQSNDPFGSMLNRPSVGV